MFKLFDKIKKVCTEWDEPDDSFGVPHEELPTTLGNTEIVTDAVVIDPPKRSYFSIEELSYSVTAHRMGIDNTPPPEAEKNMQALIDAVLDPIRYAYGSAITVSSGYRCEALNKAVGGVWNSQHLTGSAADITVGTREANKVLWGIILSLDVPFDQLIDESNLLWIHISYDKTRNRRQVLKL